MYYLDVFKNLNEANVRYLVIGGTALNLYGIPRPTYDLDIMLAMDETNILSAISILEQLGYKPRLPVSAKEFANAATRKMWKEKKNMLAFSFIKSEKEFQTVDFVFEQPLDFTECDVHKEVRNIDGIMIPVISVDDLIELKKHANRKQDISDVETLKKLR